MVTVRQFARGMGRAARAVERAERRQYKEQLAYHRALEKQALLDSAADAADAHARLIAQLTHSHRVSFDRRDWHGIAARETPIEPPRSEASEQAASARLAAYSPGWFVRTFGLAEGQRNKLRQAVRQSRLLDDQVHAENLSRFEKEREEIEHARKVVELEAGAVTKAVNDHAALDAGAIEGATLTMRDGRIVVIVDAADIDDMPTESVTLLASGKASVKGIPRAKILELHRDAVCSAAIRVAAEILKALPIDEVEIVAMTDLLDPGSGHITAEPVLYLRVTAQALASVNLANVEPSALVERLDGHFDWSRKDGLRRIPLQSRRLPQDLYDEYGW